MNSDFSKDWKKYLEGALNPGIIIFLDERFKDLGIDSPVIDDLLSVTLEDGLNSFLSITSVYEFELFKQQLNNK